MDTNVKNTKIIELPIKKDDRGSLCFFETENHIPFPIKRIFYIFDTKDGAIRGNHAHKESWQVHVCLGGSAKIMLDDGVNKQEVIIDKPNTGLIIGPMVWHSFILDKGANFFVASSNLYNEKDYIRDYTEFKKLV